MKKNSLKLMVIVMAFAVMLACDRSTPLALYEPRSQEEQSLKSVLMAFQDGVIDKDADTVMRFIHEQASIMINGHYLSKTEYARILPDRLAENSHMALGKPKMKVSGDGAQIRIYMTRGDNTFLVNFNMKKEDGNWYIMGWEY